MKFMVTNSSSEFSILLTTLKQVILFSFISIPLSYYLLSPSFAGKSTGSGIIK